MQMPVEDCDVRPIQRVNQARELAGEFDYTFYANNLNMAADYGPVVLEINTRGIEDRFEPFGRTGEWVTDERVPFSAVKDVHYTGLTGIRRRPAGTVPVRRYLRRRAS